MAGRIFIHTDVEQEIETRIPGLPGIPPRVHVAGPRIVSHQVMLVREDNIMADFVGGIRDFVIRQKLQIAPNSAIHRVEVLKEVGGQDVWVNVTGKMWQKTIKDVVTNHSEEREGWVAIVYRQSVENVPFGINFQQQQMVGCNFCGKRERYMKVEKTGKRRIFCHNDCQNRFYAGSFAVDIEEATKHNSHYRHVLNTTQHQQLVVMNITPEDQEIGGEIHPHTTQLVRVESGKGKAVVDGVTTELKGGSLIMINPGAKHNIINTSEDGSPLKLYSVYSPPHHAPWLLEDRREKA